MKMRRLFLVGLVVSVLLGTVDCRSFHHAGVVDLRKHDLSTPEGTYGLFRAGCEADDPDAVWACLTASSRRRIGYGRFLDGWTVLGRLLPHVSRTRVIEVIPGRLPSLCRMDVGYRGRKFGFLLVQEEGSWLIHYPSPFHEPEELVEFLREVAGKKTLREDRGEWRNREGSEGGARMSPRGKEVPGFVVPLKTRAEENGR